MFRSSQCVPVLVLVLCHTQHTYSGKVLLWPGEHSHWLNMKNIVAALSAKGHEMTVLTHSATPTITADQSTSCSFEIVPVPYTAQDMTDMMDEIFHYWMYELPNESFIQVSLKIKEIIQRTTEMNKVFCRAVFKNKELLEKLRQARYDVLLTDPMFLCGELLAETLDLPLIISLRFSHANTLERLCGQLPAPPSYVPSTGKPTSVCEAMGKADIWLIRTYWDFEYPRPFLPNFKFVGGLHCKPAKPLPEDMEEFVQSSGEDGIVVFSLGSMIKNLTRERRDVIASALGQISQKVLWRYSGEKPDTLPPNIRLLDWIPQNDLLGHPKTKAFITHGGTNGMYEAIYHGVPMVGIPLFGDQPDNMHHMKTKGAAVILDLNQFQGQDLVLAVNAVINDPSYKESTMRLSRIHHDQPMSALDQAVFWIEFVMRNKGAKHLRVQAHNLSWYQYHCLDVLAALLATVVLIAVIFFKARRPNPNPCRHCRRRTRGAADTERLIAELIQTFHSAKGHDTMGIPLLDHDRIQAIWEEQRRHLHCRQDPPGLRELIGVEYLYSQTGRVLQDVSLDPDTLDKAADIQDMDLDVKDEGFEEEEDDCTVHCPTPSLQQPSQEIQLTHSRLGHHLQLPLKPFLNAKVDELVSLWSVLPDANKSRLIYPSRHWERIVKGQVKSTKGKTSVVPGKESPTGVRRPRWAAVLAHYIKIRELVLGSPRLIAQTMLQLFELNQRTLSQWFSRRQKAWERAVLQQDVVGTRIPAMAYQQLPPPRGDRTSGLRLCHPRRPIAPGHPARKEREVERLACAEDLQSYIACSLWTAGRDNHGKQV
ncbi:hypothetical protein COCON_G00166410 [Conger conger]|uniref:UDP-glycosyltransferases domain-containing protein n=1 Tax=Conger conger TaxID=82655 RepID=A0A9Q1D6Z0_CONCO|nr:hypothetical protein COCON_G00166410 [Conger conger]